jgi:hypothetical protein
MEIADMLLAAAGPFGAAVDDGLHQASEANGVEQAGFKVMHDGLVFRRTRAASPQ